MNPGDRGEKFWQNRNQLTGKTMLSRNLGQSDLQSNSWSDLGHGAPTILGYANLCSRAMGAASGDVADLAPEALAILAVAATRGTIDIRASREPFDSAERFLAVCVEHELDQRLLFLQKSDPKQTIRFLEGFRQLCAAGFMIHHLQRDFSLSVAGFEAAEKLKKSDYESLLEFAVEIEH